MEFVKRPAAYGAYLAGDVSDWIMMCTPPTHPRVPMRSAHFGPTLATIGAPARQVKTMMANRAALAVFEVRAFARPPAPPNGKKNAFVSSWSIHPD